MTSNWKLTLSSIELEEQSLYSGIVCAAAFSVYMGPYNNAFRKKMLMKHWSKCLVDRGIPVVNSRSNILSSVECNTSSNDSVKVNENEATLEDNDSSVSESKVLSYHNYILFIIKCLVGEELCRHWLTLNYDSDDLENLAIINTPLRKSLFFVDPHDRLKMLINQVKIHDQPVVELDVTQR